MVIDLFYYLAGVFLLAKLYYLPKWREGLGKAEKSMATVKDRLNSALGEVKNISEKDDEELDIATNNIKGILRNHAEDIVESSNPSKLSNFLSTLALIWMFVGLASDLWYLFAINIGVALLVSLYPMFGNPTVSTRKKLFFLSMITEMVILSLILYIHF